jgi:hypothetical protein
MQPERLLCCNVLTSDEHSQPEVFRHSFYSFDGPVEWPPPRWKEGRCLYCCHPFDAPAGGGGEGRVFVQPVPIATWHDKRTDEWRVSGMFCSWSCAKSELLSQQGYACGNAVLLLDELARTVFGYTGPEIVPAPPKTRLSFFYPGEGSLDIDAFRQESGRSYTTVLKQPLLSSPEIYETHSLATTSAPSWSVKGIRAKTAIVPAPPDMTRDADYDMDGDAGSRFSSFIRDKRSADAGPAACGSGERASKGQERTEGTLVNWMDKQQGAR